jgi:hypothetical protein
MIDEKQLEIIAKERCPKASQILGIDLQRVCYLKRRILKRHIETQIVPSEKANRFKQWTTEDDQTLLKEFEKNSVAQAAIVLKRTRKEIKERLDLVLQKEKDKLPIIDILLRFPAMLPGQIQQMKDIYTYSPKSALRYCEAIEKYRQSLIKDLSNEDKEQI